MHSMPWQVEWMFNIFFWAPYWLPALFAGIVTLVWLRKRK
jgi:hypothetical protein